MLPTDPERETSFWGTRYWEVFRKRTNAGDLVPRTNEPDYINDRQQATKDSEVQVE
jgi:hypothetical protein